MAAVLNTKVFLERVWPTVGPYYIAVPMVNKETGKAGYAHYGFDTIDECVAKAQELCFSGEKDVYFVVHAVTQKKKLDPRGFMRADRTHENMREARVFFGDLDVGEEEEPAPGKTKIPKYTTKEEAIAGIERFIFRTGLPRPLIVQSGGGYHIYWILTTPIDSLTWRTHADRLRFLMRKHGLKNDPMRTTDQSSVLRVAGTKNYKPHVMAPVRAIDAGEETETAVFLELLAGLTPDYEPLAAVHRASENASGGLAEYSGRLTPVKELFSICAQMRRFEELKGNVHEPEWYNNLGLLRWATGGEDKAHEISSGYAMYDLGETQMKMDQWSDKNPPTCRTIQSKSGAPELCDACPHFAKKSNPLHVANKEWEKTVKLPTPVQLAPANSNASAKPEPIYTPLALSPPYGRVNSGLGKYQPDPDDKTVNVLKVFCSYDMFPVASYRGESDSEEDAYSYWVLDIPILGKHKVRINHHVFGYLPEFNNAMRRLGVYIPDEKDQSELRKFMLHYLRQLQTQTSETDMFTHVGWVKGENDNIKTFVLYEQSWDFIQKAFKHCAMARNMQNAKPMFGQRGTLEGQIESLNFFHHPDYLRMQYMILASLASPWLYITGEAGVILAMVGPTAAGKTMTLRTCSQIWGIAEHYMLGGQNESSTLNAKVDRMMLMNNLPFTMDEFTNAEPKEVNALALLATQPTGKVRLDKNSGVKIHRSGQRSNFVMVSTNDSLIQLCASFNLAGSAAQQRIVEILFPAFSAGKVIADRAMRKIMANGGHIGPAAMAHLLPDHVQIEDEIRDMMDQMTVTYKVAPAERFRVNHLAVILVIGRRLKDAGLVPFDADEIIKWFVSTQLRAMRAEVKLGVVDNEELVAQFLGEIHGETLKIDTDPQGNVKGTLVIPPQKIGARFDISDNTVTFATYRFKRWCDERRVNSQRVLAELTERGFVSGQGKFDMTRGVDSINVPRTFCHKLDLTKMSGVVQNAVK